MDKKLLAVMGLALALPTTVLAVAWAVLELIDSGVIGYAGGMAIILAVIVNFFFLMFRHLRKRPEESEEFQQDDQ